MNLINSLKITWLSPEEIRKLSFGKVTNHGILEARTYRPKLGGLCSPDIFGPHISFECYCGRYKGKKNQGQKCERCGVLVANKNIQRWRMGHIELKLPIVNMALFKSISSVLSKLLGITTKKLEDVIYCRSYIVMDNGQSDIIKKKQIFEKEINPHIIANILDEIISSYQETDSTDIEKKKQTIINQAKKLKKELISEEKEEDETSYNKKILFWNNHLKFLREKWGVLIETGGEAFLKLLKTIDLKKEIEQSKDSKTNKSNRDKIKFCQSFLEAGMELEWMVFRNLPVLPCGLRPATRLKKGDISHKETIATTAINNSYRKVILANENISYYLESKEWVFFGELIFNNAKRRLQKAVDQLIQGNEYKQQKEQVKGIIQHLSGKEGLLRQYSLGKRTDYSGRAVIAPNTSLSLDQIEIPAQMAIALFKPNIIGNLLRKKIVFTVEEANELIKKETTGVLNGPSQIINEINEICSEHMFLFNRPPSLHRLSLQAAYAKLTLDKTININAVVTTPQNADFDGDGEELWGVQTKDEIPSVKENILTSSQLIDPKNGRISVITKQDISLGLYYLTKEKKNKEIRFYNEIDIIWKEYELRKNSLHSLFALPAHLLERNFSNTKNQFIFTTLGKIIINQVLPKELPYINNIEEYNQKRESYQIKTFSIEESEKEWQQLIAIEGWTKKDVNNFLDIMVRENSSSEVSYTLNELKNIGFEYAKRSGISISPFELGTPINEERKKETIKQIEKKIKEIEYHYTQGLYSEKEKKEEKIRIWQECKDNLRDELLEFLEKNCQDTSFYQIWKSGARISSETLVQILAMRGHVVNYLGDIIEDPVISSMWEGLNAFESLILNYGMRKGMIDISLKTAESGYLTRRLVGAAQEVIVKENDCGTSLDTIFTETNAQNLIFKIYGRYLSRDIKNQEQEIILKANTLLEHREAKIIKENNITAVYAYSPLNCELIRGVCQKCYGGDPSKNYTPVSLGTAVGIIAAQSLGQVLTQLTMWTFHTGGITSGKEDIVQSGIPLIKSLLDNIEPQKNEKATIAKYDGIITSIEDKVIKQKIKNKEEEIIYPYNKEQKLIVSVGEMVEKGKKLTTGVVSLDNYLEIISYEDCQNYIKEKIKEAYTSQGIEIYEKHFEIFVRQMLSRVKIISGNDKYLEDDIVEYQLINKINKQLSKEGKKNITFKPIISSLKILASSSTSFLASASFQSPLKTLVHYSIYHPIDELENPQACIITGQLPPVGDGFKEKEKYRYQAKQRILDNEEDE